MIPSRETGGLGFHKATVQIPAEAWGMDLTFSDSGQVKQPEMS